MVPQPECVFCLSLLCIFVADRLLFSSKKASTVSMTVAKESTVDSNSNSAVHGFASSCHEDDPN